MRFPLPADAKMVRRPRGPLVRARDRIPVSLRIAARRFPAVVRHYVAPPTRCPRRAGAWPVTQCTRSSPLHRPGTAYDRPIQSAKVTNVRRAAELLDGVVLAPGALFSWHAEVGPPLRARGFARGPELHADRLAVGTGGGACQVANLVFWLALHAGLDIVERHRHGLDLFPDSQRTVPFGCGATVFHPTRDLKLSNPHPWAVRLSLTTTADDLVGAVQLAAPVSPTWRVVEAWHRFVRRADGIWRENQLDRERHDPPRPVVREIVAVNRARVRYPVAPELLQPESPEVA